MARLGLERHIVDQDARDRTVVRFRERGIRLPTFAELAEPWRIPADIRAALVDVDPDAPDPLNLFRVHWYNAADRRGLVDVPGHVVLPRERELVSQVHSIKRRILPSGKVSFDAERTSRGHADRFWAIALACQKERGPAPSRMTEIGVRVLG